MDSYTVRTINLNVYVSRIAKVSKTKKRPLIRIIIIYLTCFQSIIFQLNIKPQKKIVLKIKLFQLNLIFQCFPNYDSP